MAEQTEVATKVEELSTTLNVDVEDITITIEDGGLGETVISGADVVEYLSEGEDEQTPTESEDDPEGVDEDDDTIEDGDEQSTTEPTTEGGHLKGDGTKCQISEAIEDCHVHSIEDGEEEEATIEDGDDDTISDSELVEKGVKKSNIEDVRKYRSKNGVCSEENCPYGANDDSEFCASHQGSSSSSKKNKSSSKKTKNYKDLTEGQKGRVEYLISDEDMSFEEAVNKV